jgi:hypothetical protein
VFFSDEVGPPRMPITAIDKADLDQRVLAGIRRIIRRGGLVYADERHALSMPNLARKSPDLQNMPYNALYACQERLEARGQIVLVKVKGHCVARPADGPTYEGEEPWG